MASLRAIEGGFSLLRSTRFGLSAGFDQYGRARGWESSFDSGRRVLLVALPTRRIETLYSRIGDVLVALCAAFVTAAAASRVAAARRSRAAAPAGAASPTTSS
jgi:apolipoprotein N-acyltransferase